ncbi:MAG: hypothetical protein PHU44_17805 [Syntrophales bacterium]|nr:hypothetical protein [Syntrophales bacterium]MDD5641522.1 hypothetical protein [Syntrophales bacterium]
MAKYGIGKLYADGLLYGFDPQYLSGVGNIPSATAVGMPTVNPGPVTIYGVGNIETMETFGALRISQIPQNMALLLDGRRLRVSPAGRYLMAAPQIRRLQVTPDA